MQVSTTSWHYRLIDKRYIPATNICPYMRQLFKSIGRLLFLALAAILIVFVAVSPLIWLAHQVIPFLPNSWLVSDTPDMVPVFMLSVITATAVYCFLAIAAAFLYTKERVEEYTYTRRQQRLESGVEPTPREPGLFVTWLKGLHDKTCTSIEFVEPETH